MKKIFLSLTFVFSFSIFTHAQIEGAYVRVKDFKAFGFGAFLNFAIPVSEGSNFVTLEGGMKYFKNSDEEDMGIFPVLLGYRYTLDGSGTGLYLEPYAGYTFGGTTIGVYENDTPLSDGNGNWLYEKVAGPAVGAGVGYLFQPNGKIQFNLALRYDHSFGNTATNMIALRLTHAFQFGRRNE